MAIILLDRKMLSEIPDIIDQIRKITGNAIVKKSSEMFNIWEVRFSYLNFEENEIVMARIVKQLDRSPLKLFNIISMQKHYVGSSPN